MSDEMNVLLRAIREAGDEVFRMQQEGFEVARKTNNDLVTAADLRANDILKSALLGTFPDDGWLSEESVDDEKRLVKKRVWIVDPIDGTIEYAHGIPEYAVSVALVESGVPMLAAVYNPAKKELYHAVKGQGAWLNGSRIYCDKAKSSTRFVLLASRSEDKRGEWNRFKEAHQVKIIGSIAYKLALIASGAADATFSLGPKSEWDIAAGVLLVNEAGGLAVDQTRRHFIFNQRDVLVNGIVGSAGNIVESLFRLIGSR